MTIAASEVVETLLQDGRAKFGYHSFIRESEKSTHIEELESRTVTHGDVRDDVAHHVHDAPHRAGGCSSEGFQFKKVRLLTL